MAANFKLGQINTPRELARHLRIFAGVNVAITSEFSVGPDKVRLVGDEVTVFAVRAMPDWTVREFCRVPIHFQGNKYYLLRKTAGPHPYAFQYQLAPWHSDLGAESSRSISYDEAYVAHRDEQFRSEPPAATIFIRR